MSSQDTAWRCAALTLYYPWGKRYRTGCDVALLNCSPPVVVRAGDLAGVRGESKGSGQPQGKCVHHTRAPGGCWCWFSLHQCEALTMSLTVLLSVLSGQLSMSSPRITLLHRLHKTRAASPAYWEMRASRDLNKLSLK